MPESLRSGGADDGSTGPVGLTTAEARADLERRYALDRIELEREKKQAASEGKEPFDLDKFDELYVVPNAEFARTLDREDRIRRWEQEYYMGFGRKTATIAEFASLRKYTDDNWS